MLTPKRLAWLPLLAAAACFPPSVDLENLHCSASGQCVSGYVCVNNLCVKPEASTSGSASSTTTTTSTATSSSGSTSSTSSTSSGSSSSSSSTSGSGSTGSTSSGSGSASGSGSGSSGSGGTTGCAASAEVCDGQDNDCDGVPDNVGEDGGFACVQGASDGGACESYTCFADGGLPGTLACDSTCGGYTVCQAPAEVCNRRDDNCDGNVDEGLDGSTQGVAGPGTFGAVALAALPGSALAVYTDLSASPAAVQVQLLDAQLAPSGAPVGRPPSADQVSPAVVSVDGGFRVAWVEGSDVLTLPVSASGVVGLTSAVNTVFTSPQNVVLASSSAGVAFAFENAGSPASVIVKVPGSSERDVTISASFASTSPALAAQPDGSGYAVAYARSGAVRVALLDGTGATLLDQPVSSGFFDSAPTVVWDGAEYAVAWQASFPDAGSDIAFATELLDGGLSGELSSTGLIHVAFDGGPSTPVIYVDPAPGTSESPRLAAGNGLLYLAWDDDRSGVFEARMVRIDASGTVVGGPVVLDAATDPSLAPAPAFSGTDFGAAWIGGGAATVDARLTCF